MAIRPPVQVRHKHAMVSVAHVQLAQRAVSQTPSGKETLRKKRLVVVVQLDHLAAVVMET